ncbi:hypothetical protein CWN93_19585, partial [Vibrio splendidus]
TIGGQFRVWLFLYLLLLHLISGGKCREFLIDTKTTKRFPQREKPPSFKLWIETNEQLQDM